MDRSRYPPNWEEISDQVRERDNWTCQHCGVKQGDEIPADDPYAGMPPVFPEHAPERPAPTKVRISVAHLDRDETNWDVSLDRLTSLCMGCHLRYDAEDNHRRRRYGRKHVDNQLSLF